MATTEKVKGFSPVLDAILHGGSSVSMNVIEMAKNFPKEKLLFRSSAMNGVVIFKFPNFVDDVGKELMGAFGGPAAIEYHPIETGVYLPYSTEAPQDGGCAIYMRQKNYQQLLMDYVGLPSDNVGDANLSQDIKLLSLMDTIPSLDPFLLKECFDANGISYDPSVLRLDPREEEDIKRMISEKISPIVQKAFDSERTTSSRERLLAALWNPTMPEAKFRARLRYRRCRSGRGVHRLEGNHLLSAPGAGHRPEDPGSSGVDEIEGINPHRCHHQ